MLRACVVLVALCPFLFAAAPAAAEGGRRDQDDARAAVESGAILPLETILARVKGRLRGDIVKVKLEREHGLWIYEFRVVDPEGHLREIIVDATTGALKDAGDD